MCVGTFSSIVIASTKRNIKDVTMGTNTDRIKHRFVTLHLGEIYEWKSPDALQINNSLIIHSKCTLFDG
jgi:hypothetical protein